MPERRENERDRQLEELLRRTLRDVPLRDAPATLESRVLGELQRRAGRPWWRRSFVHWPLPVRAAFIALCIGLSVTDPGSWRPLSALTAWPVQQVPPPWLYAALLAGAALYAMLFGLGAVAYRTLYLKPPGR